MLKRIWNDKTGATAIEYAIIASMVSIVAIGAFVLLGGSVRGYFQTVDSAYKSTN